MPENLGPARSVNDRLADRDLESKVARGKATAEEIALWRSNTLVAAQDESTAQSINDLSESELRDRFAADMEKGRALIATRAAAGMGFWRLVGIVALGVLIAQAIGALAAFLIRSING